MNKQTFLDSFGHIADAPGGIDKLRSLVLDLAVRGRLTHQALTEEPATEVLKRIAGERDRLVRAKEIRKPPALPPLAANGHAFDVPESWSWARLGDVCQSRLGKMLDGQKNTGTPTPYLRNSNVQWGRFELGDVKRILLEDAELSEYSLQDGDLLVVEGGEPGRCAIWDSAVADGVMVFQKALHRVRPEGGISPRFVALVLRNGVDSGRLHELFTGTTIKHLTGEKLKRFVIPLPPIEEQHRIVERVDELTDLCDEMEQQIATRTEARSTLLAATLHRVSESDQADDLRAAVGTFVDNIGLHLAPGEGDLAALKRMRQTILDLAVRGRLTHQDPDDMPATDLLTQIAAERDRLVKAKGIRKPKKFAPVAPGEGLVALPEGWIWARANEFFIASDSGWSPRCLVEQAGPGEWGVLKTSAVSRGVFEEAANKKLPPALEPRPQLEVQPGEFVMIRASGSKSLVGRGAIVTETESHLMLSDKHIRLSFLSKASTRYWAILNDSTEVQRYYSAESSGTSTMSNVTRDRIGALAVPVPPLDEQIRIAETVDVLFALCDDLEQQLLAAQDARTDLGNSVAAHAS
ncbi:restriction endonuclease subunit S [Rhodococcus sp. NPDC054953]